ncbi:heme-binding protein [Nocardia sp. NPDC057272]|uniref:GlcG/HbpS family heme-binding protein n=1 Tax=Nocardia sp. NPDC057272 TaxID=3346079 RepID=UPI003634F172
MSISLDQADAVIAAARDTAAQLGQPVSMAVVDTEGRLVGFARMDGAPTSSIDAANRKADAARALGFDTVHFSGAAQQGQSLLGGPKQSGAHSLVRNGGGVIIRIGGTISGTFGVSGTSSSITDHKIAAAAVARLR